MSLSFSFSSASLFQRLTYRLTSVGIGMYLRMENLLAMPLWFSTRPSLGLEGTDVGAAEESGEERSDAMINFHQVNLSNRLTWARHVTCPRASLLYK